MEISKFKASDWLKVGGGAVFLIAGFLTWWNYDAGVASGTQNAFDFFFTGIVPWLLFVAIGVIAFLLAAEIYNPPANVPAPLILLAASAFALLLVIIRFFSDGIDNDFDALVESSRGIGLFLALLAGIAVIVGCVLGFKEAGGDLADLKDVNKLRSAFDRGPGTPGAPGGPSTPPPPPAPPTGGPPPPPSA